MSSPGSLRQALKNPRHRTVVVTVVGFAGLAIWAAVRREHNEISSASGHGTATLVDQATPAESFATVSKVIALGGAPLARETALAWLDRQARERQPLDAEAEKLLLGTLRNGGHPEWSAGYCQHLFNSACNALRIRPSDGGDTLARILQSQALSHPNRVLRLYALQHIDSMRKSGQITAPLAEEIHNHLLSLATAPDSDVAGTALLTLNNWDALPSGTVSASVALAGQIAADRSRQIDVRVSAIHSAGAASLEPARIIAADTTEPVLLRKAAIARIGRHGDRSDLRTLQSLRTESARLAQAADPALKALQARLNDSGNPAPKPYLSLPTRPSP